MYVLFLFDVSICSTEGEKKKKRDWCWIEKKKKNKKNCL